MNKDKDKLQHDLEQVAKKHGMKLWADCAYCGHSTEVVDPKGEEVSFFFTFSKKLEE